MNPIIYTSSTCGWALRNYAVLLEKGVAFTLVPARDKQGEKTPEFLASTPLGLTPSLTIGNSNVWESRKINEFLDEYYPTPGLMPPDPPERAEGRCWEHYCDNVLIPAVGSIMKHEENASEKLSSALDVLLGRCTIEKGFFYDSGFSLVDIVFFTLFDLMDTLTEMDLATPYEDRPSLLAWADNIKSIPCLQGATSLPELIGDSPLQVEADYLASYTSPSPQGVNNA